MKLNEYQKLAMRTTRGAYENERVDDALLETAICIAGEAGELGTGYKRYAGT